MSSAAIIGREAELSALTEFLEDACGASATLVLSGDPGAGKTTLWHAGVAAAVRRGFTVLQASPAAAETSMSFAALADLLTDVVDDVLPALPPPQRRALEVALLLTDPDGAGPEQRAVAVAFLSVVLALSGSGPVLVAVDDAQWLDAASAGVLRYTARRLRGERVGLLVAERATEPASSRRGIAGPWADGRVARVELGALTMGAVHRLLHESLGLVVSRPVLRRIHETSVGNPLYALEIARVLDYEAVGASGKPLPVPPSLSELVRDRLAALPPATRSALLIASALSDPRVAVVGAALGADVDQVLQVAIDAHVISADGDRLRFVHPLLASAAYALADDRERRDVHRRLAALVEDIEERARHLAQAAQGPDEMTATTLERAAEHAGARGATVAAAELFEQARRLTADHRTEQLHRRTIAAARYRYSVGDMDVARRLFEAAVAAAPAGPDRAEALVGLAFLVAFEGDQPAAAQLARRALEEGRGREPVRADAARVLSSALLFMREDLEGALSQAELAVECAERQRDEGLRAGCLGAKATIETLLGRPEARATCEAAVALEFPTHRERIVSAPQWNLAVVLGWTDALIDADRLGRECHDLASALGDESSLPLIAAQRAITAYEIGRYDDARLLADEALEIALQTGQRPQQALALAARALLHASLGLEPAARADACDALTLAGERSMAVARIHAVRALGLLDLSIDRPQEALRVLTPQRVRLLAAGVTEPGSIRFLADEIEALIAVGRLDEAGVLLEWLEERGRSLDRASALAAAGRCRGLMLGARHDDDRALAALVQALTEHERVPMPLEHARTLLALGSAQRRAQRKREARETLGRALAAFERLGACAWAERVRAETGRIGGRPPADGGLTPSEQQIAALVAEGRTNREVATALFISDRTVESHLSHIYRKLGIRSRAALARRLSV